MLFSSLTFIFVFLPVVILLYYIVKPAYRNAVLLFASLLFYSWGEPIYVSLMLISIIFNYFFGLYLKRFANQRTTKLILLLCIIFNLSFLGFYKYINFALVNYNLILGFFEIPAVELLNLTLPIGISFYTFQAMSYVIDVYRGETRVNKSILNIGLYITFFPQLIAGPIVRYHDIATQIDSRPGFNNEKFKSGVRRFIIGLSKKVLIANTMAEVADGVFSSSPDWISSGAAWIGVIAYTLQIYYDFSGYSCMAIGLARMFGFELLENFNYPYISSSIKEFWRRWHISLSSWFRDYLYIPLGGNRAGIFRKYMNQITVFILCGFWHGASWTFLFWGIYHGLFLTFENISFIKKAKLKIPSFVNHFYALLVIMIGWVFFRSDNFTYASEYLFKMFSFSGISIPPDMDLSVKTWVICFLGIIGATPFLSFLRSKFMINKSLLSLSIDVILILFFVLDVMMLSSSAYNPFIYFRF